MNHTNYFPNYINYEACDNGAYSTTQDHSRQKKHPRQNHNSHDSRRQPHHHDARYTGPAPDAIFKDYLSTCYSQPQSIDPSLILDPLYETTPAISQEYAQEYTYAATIQTTHNVCYATPRGISPSSSDSSMRSMDSWHLHNMSSMSSPASSISSRRPSPMPEPHPRPSTHCTKSSHLRVQTGSVAIRPSIVSPRQAKRATPYLDSSDDGPDGKKKWACQNCGKKFTRDSDRKRHCDESTSCPKKTKVYDENDSDIRFACEYCQKQFSRYDSLERHRKNPTACTGRPKARH